MIGVVSDVHANLAALEAALDALAGVERIVCAGDLVGYGPQPNETVALLREAGAACVTGNHDLVAVDRASLARCDELAATTLAWTRGVLDETTRAYLAGLPQALDDGGLLVTHGAPGDPWHYVRTPADAAAQLAAVPDAPLLVVGHTHRAAAVDERGEPTAAEGELALGPGRWLLNPGSVGQSRERAPVARAMTLDLERRTARFHVLDYDVERTRAELRRIGLPLEAMHRRPRNRLRRFL